MLNEILKEREYPEILKMNDETPVNCENWGERRKELLALLEKYSYGKTPEPPVKVWGEVTESDSNSYAGKVLNEKVSIFMETEKGVFSFPVEFFIPKKEEKPPVFFTYSISSRSRQIYSR